MDGTVLLNQWVSLSLAKGSCYRLIHNRIEERIIHRTNLFVCSTIDLSRHEPQPIP